MKLTTQNELERGRPEIGAGTAVEFCLHRLYEDRMHLCGDEVVRGLTFEELIGALLLARDGLHEHHVEAVDAPQGGNP